MMKKRRMVTLLLAMLFLLSTKALLAAEPEATPYYAAYTGIIKEISGLEESSRKVVIALPEDGGEIILLATGTTYIPEHVGLKEGMSVVGFSAADRPAPAIFPPRYFLDILAPAEEGVMIYADYFDENLLSRDGSLILHIDETAEIQDMLGRSVDPEMLPGQKLLVYYEFVNETYPAQTTPVKIVLLYDRMDGPEDEPAVESEDNLHIIELEQPENTGITIQVLDTADVSAIVRPKFDRSAPFELLVLPDTDVIMAEDGAMLAPLRSVCETMEIPLAWDGDTGTVTVNDDFSFIPEIKETLDAETPLLVNGVTYVPVAFFQMELGLGFKITTMQIQPLTEAEIEAYGESFQVLHEADDEED